MNFREFDRYAHEYDEALTKGIRISGQDRNFFARHRIAWLLNELRKNGAASLSVMDFGCGTGSSTPYFFDLLGVRSVLGVDISPKSLEVARQKHSTLNAQFVLMDEYQPSGVFDLAFCNGVFHHIPPDSRIEVISYIYCALRQKGILPCGRTIRGI